MGKQIRIYLADGNSSGIRHAEITNWTGQALACPRARFQELREWDEVKRPGVYFLFGLNEETGEDAVYIGEAEVVLERISTHMSGKGFWNELITFTSKDDNLTKGHVRYLEARLIELSIAAKRYQVTNAAMPQLPALPLPDRDAMEEYLLSVKTLLGVLGHRVLEPLVTTSRPSLSDALVQPQTVQQSTEMPVSGSTQPVSVNPTFKMHISDLSAYATRTDEGLVVLTESEAAATVQGSLSGGYRVLRDKLLQSGVLVLSGTKLKFTRDHLFSSPSQAAAVIVGYSINGRDVWRLSNGTTYAAYEERLSETLLNELSSSQ
jgi:hypothetical protein